VSLGFGVASRYPSPPVGRITPLGPYFVDASGQIVIRKSVTAFTLPKRYATGRADDANAYLDWAAAAGFNEVRVFTQVDWDGVTKGVESGWAYDEAACDQTATEAASRGLRVEFVAHTYPVSASAGAEHLRAVDALCQRHENALLEVWNEPQQNGGQDLLNAVLSAYRPQTLGWSSGWYQPTPYPSGQSVTYHSPRDGEWPRKFKDAYEFSTGQGPTQGFAPGFAGPVMLDEPPQVEQTLSADDWCAYGAGAAFFACGATMHSNPTLQRCEVPTDPAVLTCIDAFIAGFAEVPVQRYHGYFHPDDQGSLRRYNRWGDDGKKYEISVRPFAFGVVA
jgi:hypothetical protein